MIIPEESNLGKGEIYYPSSTYAISNMHVKDVSLTLGYSMMVSWKLALFHYF